MNVRPALGNPDPTATFRLTEPLALGEGFTGGDRATADATGDLVKVDPTGQIEFLLKLAPAT